MGSSEPSFSTRRGLVLAILLVAVIIAGVIGAVTSLREILPRTIASVRTATPTAALPVGAPSLALSPQAGRPGTRIVVSGRGWRPGNTVTIRLEDPAAGRVSPDQASAIVSAGGEFSVRFTYPDAAPWAALPTASVVAVDSTLHLRVSAAFDVVGAVTGTPTPAPTPLPLDTATATPVIPTLPPPTAAPTLPPPTVPPSPSTTPPAPTATRSPAPTATTTPPPVIIVSDWRGEYYPNTNLVGAPALIRNDSAVDFNWGFGVPGPGVPADGFSARWTRMLDLAAATYRFYLTMDDGARLWIDNQLALNEWRDGGTRTVSVDYPLTRGAHAFRVEYYDRTGAGRVQLRWERLGMVPITDWQGLYWANPNLAGDALLVRNDLAVDFNWGAAPALGLPADNFSARWTRAVSFAAGRYRLFVQADDGVRLYVDDRLVINEWHDGSGATPYSVELALGGTHTLRVEYYDHTGAALVRFWWQPIEATATPTATLTGTAAATRTPTATLTPSVTPTETATATLTPAPTATATATPTASPTATLTPSVTPTETATATLTPAPTATATATPTASPTATLTPSVTPTETATATATASLTPSPTPDENGSATATPTATALPVDETATAAPAERMRPTKTATPTLVSLGPVRLNELLSAPKAVDWDGNGVKNAADEWIELSNAGKSVVDLSNWRLEAGRGVYRFPRGTTLRPEAILILYQKQTRLILDDAGGEVRLVDRAGKTADSVRYPALTADASFGRDATNAWHSDWPPSPGKPNLAPAVTGTPTAAKTLTPTPTVTPR